MTDTGDVEDAVRLGLELGLGSGLRLRLELGLGLGLRLGCGRCGRFTLRKLSSLSSSSKKSAGASLS